MKGGESLLFCCSSARFFEILETSKLTKLQCYSSLKEVTGLAFAALIV